MAYFDGLCGRAGVRLRINQVELAYTHGGACARSPGGEEEATGVNIDHLINSSSTINFSVLNCGERAPARTFAGFRTVSVHTSTQMTHSSSSSRSPFPSLSSGHPSLSVSVD